MIICRGHVVTLSAFAALATRILSRQSALDVRAVRAALILRGTSLHAWASTVGKRPQYVQLAVRGQRRGPIARRIVAALKRDLGM